MGSSCAPRIDFPGAEFTPAAAAASGTRGGAEQGAEPRGSCAERTRSRRPPRRTFPAGSWRALGSASAVRLCAARPPSCPSHTPEAEDLLRSAPARGDLWALDRSPKKLAALREVA